MEIETRQTAVATASLIANAYTGLATRHIEDAVGVPVLGDVLAAVLDSNGRATLLKASTLLAA